MDLSTDRNLHLAQVTVNVAEIGGEGEKCLALLRKLCDAFKTTSTIFFQIL